MTQNRGCRNLLLAEEEYWSKRNREHIARLIKEKRMTAIGLKEIDMAKKDGRWEGALRLAKEHASSGEFFYASVRRTKNRFT